MKEAEPKAAAGNPHARRALAEALISLAKLNAIPAKYSSEEIVYLVKSSLYHPYECDEKRKTPGIDRGEAVYCDAGPQIAMNLMAILYRDGMGVPRNATLQECWRSHDIRDFPRCEFTELEQLGYIPRGQRPAGFR